LVGLKPRNISREKIGLFHFSIRFVAFFKVLVSKFPIELFAREKLAGSHKVALPLAHPLLQAEENPPWLQGGFS